MDITEMSQVFSTAFTIVALMFKIQFFCKRTFQILKIKEELFLYINHFKIFL